MAFAVIGSANYIGGSSTVDSQTTGGFDTSLANLIVLMVAYAQGLGAPAVSDSKSNSWTPLTVKSDSGGYRSIAFYYSYVTSVGASHTFTASLAGGYPSICVLACSGMLPAGFDVQNGTVTTTDPAPTGNVTPTQNNSLIVVGFATAGSPNVKMFSDAFTYTTSGGNSGYNAWMGHMVQATAASVGASFDGKSALAPSATVIASFKIAKQLAIPADILAIGGGGGGGGGLGGGGGGGGFIDSASTRIGIGVGSWPVVIGLGGAGGIGGATGQPGSNTTFAGLVSGGGVGGQGGSRGNYIGPNGGSGGGSASNDYGSLAAQGGFNFGYANRGGDSAIAVTLATSGGGGAGSAGVNGTDPSPSGGGGSGKASTINGTSTLYCAGGGGSGALGSSITAGAAGDASAGAGSDNGVGADAPANRGGGGGGGAYYGSSFAGGRGGDGKFIISYNTAAVAAVGKCSGGVIATNGANTYHTFTSNGVFTISSSSDFFLFF